VVRGFESVDRNQSSFLLIRLSVTVSDVTQPVAMAAEDDQRELGRRPGGRPRQPPKQDLRRVGAM